MISESVKGRTANGGTTGLDSLDCGSSSAVFELTGQHTARNMEVGHIQQCEVLGTCRGPS